MHNLFVLFLKFYLMKRAISFQKFSCSQFFINSIWSSLKIVINAIRECNNNYFEYIFS